jgi:hypothetical protein
VMRQKHPPNIHRRSLPRGEDHGDDGGYEERERELQSPTLPWATRVHRGEAPSPTLLQLSQLGVYEHILQLRKHGISIQLDQEAIPAMELLATARQLPIKPNSYSLQSSPVDIYDPPPDELERMNQAFVTVVSLGARLEIPALEPQPVFQCHACSEQFLTQTQKDKHCNRGREHCPRCPKTFPCETLREEHSRQPHNMPTRPNLEQTFSTGPTPGAWGEPTYNPNQPYDPN